MVLHLLWSLRRCQLHRSVCRIARSSNDRTQCPPHGVDGSGDAIHQAEPRLFLPSASQTAATGNSCRPHSPPPPPRAPRARAGCCCCCCEDVMSLHR